MAPNVGPALPEEVQTAMKQPKQIFGKYILIKELGRGGMGTVYKAWQLDVRRYVAIKFLTSATGPEELKRFYREAQTAGALSHPNIAAIHEIGVRDGRYFIAMDFIDGRNLDTLPAPEHEAGLKNAAKILRDAAKAVEYAHAKGIIHRDIKPSNIMVTKQGRCYITDFGLAKQVRDDVKITGTGFIVGTPTYMSPEQAQGDVKRVDKLSDVWSLGATLYTAMTGHLPFKAAGAIATLSKVVKDDPIAPSRFNSAIPRELEAICLKALEKKKERRYPRAAEFASDLDRWLRGEPTLARPLTPIEKSVRWVRRRWPVAAAAGLLVVLGVAWIVRSMAHRSEINDLQSEAQSLYFKKDYANCLQCCEKILGQGGGSEMVYSMKKDCEQQLEDIKKRGQANERRDQAQAAFRLGKDKLQEARDLRPNREAGVDRVRKLYREAIQQFESAIAIDPEWREALYEVATAYAELRDENGLKHAEQLVKLDPKAPYAYFLRAKLRFWNHFKETGTLANRMLRSEKYDAAAESRKILDDFELAVLRGISDYQLALARALNFYLNGEYEKVWDVFKEGLTKRPDDPDLLLLRAVLALILHSWNRTLAPISLPFAEAAWRVQPNDYIALFTYLLALGGHSHLAEALPLVDRALREVQEPDLQVELVETRIGLLKDGGRIDEARRAAEDYVSKRPDGFLYLALFDLSPATNLGADAKLVEKARELDWRCRFEAEKAMIAVMLDTKQKDSAASAEKVIDKLLNEKFYDRKALGRAHHALLLSRKADTRGYQGDFDGALAYSKEALALFPLPGAHYIASVACYRLGRYAEALDHVLQAKATIDLESNKTGSDANEEIESKIRRKLDESKKDK